MATELPEPLQWVLLLLAGTRWPEADEDNLRSMAEHWRTMAQTLTEVEESTDAAVERALTGQVGVAATGLSRHWNQFTVGKGEAEPGVFPGLAKGCEGMGDMLESMANSAETAKIQIIAQLGILAVEIATAEVEAPFTAGLSLAEIPVFVGISRTVVQQILKKLAMEAMKFAAKQAVQMAAINLLAQSIQVMEGHRKGLDMKELGDNAVGGAVAGASGHVLGKGVGAAGSKLGLGRAMGTLPGKMVTAGAVGVGADVVTQVATTGKVDSHSLLGSGLSGAGAAGLHAAGAAVNEHFKAPTVEVPAGAHAPEQSPSAASANAAGPEGSTGADGGRGMPAASGHAAGPQAPSPVADGAPAGGTHEGDVPAGGRHPAAGTEAGPDGPGGTHGPATEPAGGAAHPAQHVVDDGAQSPTASSHPGAPLPEQGNTGGGPPAASSSHGGEGGIPVHGPAAVAEGLPPAHAEVSSAHAAATQTPVTDAAAPASAGSHTPLSEGTPAQHAGPASAHDPVPAVAVPHEGAAAPVVSHFSSLPTLHEAAAVSAPAHETPVPVGVGHHGADVPELHVPVSEAVPPHTVREAVPLMRHAADVPELHVPVSEAVPPHTVREAVPLMRHAADVPELHVPVSEVTALASAEAPVRPGGSGPDEVRLAAGPAEGPPFGAGRPVSGMPDIQGVPALHSSATASHPGTSASVTAHPTVQSGHPSAHVPQPVQEFRTGPVRPAAPRPSLPGGVDSSPARVEGRSPAEGTPGLRQGGQSRPVRPLHEHPAGPALVYPFQKSALHKAFDKAGRLFKQSAPNPVVSDLAELLPHKSADGKYVNATVNGGAPIEGARLNTRTKTFKTDLDPKTLSDLSGDVRGTLLRGTDKELQRLPSYDYGFSGHERVEFLARQDYRTADYWKAQDVRRDRLDALAAANAERAPAGLSPRALGGVDAMLHDGPDLSTGAGRVLAEHDGFVLGENHVNSPSWAFLKNHLPALKEHGVDTLYLEALRGDSFQKHTDAYLRSPEGAGMPPELDLMVKRYDQQHKSPEGNGLQDVMAAAKAEGVRVQFVDGLPAGRSNGPWSLYDRAARFNTLAADFIDGDTGRAGKYVLLAGAAHVHPHDAPAGEAPATPYHSERPAPGLSQLLGVPGLELADRPGVEPLEPNGQPRPLADLRLVRLPQAG
ncbi:hypothetical protein [Kitasatospora sp. NBC_00039]|uniref:WXG100-like domain-containing protein n=1 Tax=Kitasatospora sp. NBC_00039 TaxID=2903565 RepID=UPI0032564964